MASENTLALRKIGRVKVTRIVRPGPGSGPKAPPTRVVTKYVSSNERISGIVGTRIGPFSERQRYLRKIEQRTANREAKEMKPKRRRAAFPIE